MSRIDNITPPLGIDNVPGYGDPFRHVPMPGQVSERSSSRRRARSAGSLGLVLGLALVGGSLTGCVEMEMGEPTELGDEVPAMKVPGAIDPEAIRAIPVDPELGEDVPMPVGSPIHADEHPEALKAGGLFANVLDQTSTDWASVRDLSSAAFSTDFSQRSSDGYMVIDIDVNEISGQQRVSAVWKRNDDKRGWQSWRNLSSADFSSKWSELRDAGYILIDQESYVLGGTQYYAGVWIQNLEGTAWASYRNVTSASFSSLFTTYSDAGYMPIDIEAYPYGGETRYSAIWIKNTEGYGWAMLRDMSAATYGNYFQNYQSSYRVLDFESYQTVNNYQRYAAIWITNNSGRKWAAWRDMSATSYGNKWLELRDAGYRLIDFEVYPYGNDYRYAGVWRQNSIRPVWEHKSEIDIILNDAMADFDIPGMSVAIAKDGQYLYTRGFGYADIGAGKIAHSGTIYRLASISKAVGGVLGLDLEDRGFLSLGNSTRTYVPSMPTHHTHRVWHTLTNRSGIGHYAENGSPSSNTHYNTAEDALGFFERNALESRPGSSYLYSTHAYTAAGAAFEAAVGQPLATLVTTQLNQRYGLGTLLPEDRSVYKSDRASLYSWNGASNVESTPDDLSWKILGGGLESSATDLVGFGTKLVQRKILDTTDLGTLWTAPDALSNYAYGWNTGTEQCADVVAKAGGQRGAKSYLRIYPDHGIVIAVLTNRGDGNHSAVSLGQTLGALLISDECP